MEQLSSSEPSAAPPAVSSSLFSRLLNVFVSPTEVFDEVKVGPRQSSNWVVPLLLSVVLGVVASLVMFSQPKVLQTIKDAQEAQFEKAVKAGQMKRQDADRIEDLTVSFAKYGAAGFALVANVCFLFLIAAIVFLLGRFAFKAPVEFKPVLEVTGLSGMILLLDGIVKMLLVVIYGNPSMSPSPILLVGNFDPHNKLHLFLATLDVIFFWYIAVLGLGLSRLCNVSWLKSALWLFCIWALLTFGLMSASYLASHSHG